MTDQFDEWRKKLDQSRERLADHMGGTPEGWQAVAVIVADDFNCIASRYLGWRDEIDQAIHDGDYQRFRLILHDMVAWEKERDQRG